MDFDKAARDVGFIMDPRRESNKLIFKTLFLEKYLQIILLSMYYKKLCMFIFLIFVYYRNTNKHCFVGVLSLNNISGSIFIKLIYT